MAQRILAIILLVGLTQILFAQSNSPIPNQISVIGSVELKEVADQASFSFSTKGVGSSLKRAVEDANRKVQLLTGKLLLIGLHTQDISTSHFYSGENYGDKAFLSSSRDYRAVLTTTIKIDSLKLLDTLLYTISDAEVENLSDISFSLKDELGLRRRARAAAASKAREKADDIAGALGILVGNVMSVEELQPTMVMPAVRSLMRSGLSSNYPNPFNPVTVTDAGEKVAIDETKGSGFFAQTISVTSQVRVIFGIK